jgi:hypothetical protein
MFHERLRINVDCFPWANLICLFLTKISFLRSGKLIIFIILAMSAHYIFEQIAIYEWHYNSTNFDFFFWMIVEASWNVMAHAQIQDFVFRQNGRVHLNQQGRQFSRLQAAELCASAVVTLNKPCSEVVWRVLATHSILRFPLHVPTLRHRVPSHFNSSLLQ